MGVGLKWICVTLFSSALLFYISSILFTKLFRVKMCVKCWSLHVEIYNLEIINYTLLFVVLVKWFMYFAIWRDFVSPHNFTFIINIIRLLFPSLFMCIGCGKSCFTRLSCVLFEWLKVSNVQCKLYNETHKTPNYLKLLGLSHNLNVIFFV